MGDSFPTIEDMASFSPFIIIIEPNHDSSLLRELCAQEARLAPVIVISREEIIGHQPLLPEDLLDELFGDLSESSFGRKVEIAHDRYQEAPGEELRKLVTKVCLEPEDEHSHSHLLNQQENMLRKTANRRGGTLRINCQQSQKRPSFRKYHNR